MKSALLSVFLFLISNCLMAQTMLIGHIQQNDGLPVNGAVVRVEGHAYNAQSDINGMFRLPLSVGTYTLRISHVGFRTLQQTVVVESVKSRTVTFILQEGVETLEEIAVREKYDRSMKAMPEVSGTYLL
ncbi:MAG: carboxypeptidase-like regulatory domain-containing protein, partial [Siphonobacter sp.]